jgi:CO/xanthine dehydrogenase Mo-binding subunit
LLLSFHTFSVGARGGEAVNELDVVGQSKNRVDGIAKVLGQAKYAADLKRKDMLIGKALFAKYPHAILKAIDVSKAAQLEGVVAVMTAGPTRP